MALGNLADLGIGSLPPPGVPFMYRPLLELLADLPDPRGRHGRQYPLAATPRADPRGHPRRPHQRWRRSPSSAGLRGHRLGHALGFRSGKMPCANTLAKLLRGLDADRLDALIGEWLAGRHAAGWGHVAIDGKVLRGSRDGEVPGTHLLGRLRPAGRRGGRPGGRRGDDQRAQGGAAAARTSLPPLRGRRRHRRRDVHARRLRRESARQAGRLRPVREGQPARPPRRHRGRLLRRRRRGLFPPSGSRSGTGTPRPPSSAGEGARPGRGAGDRHDHLAQRVPRGTGRGWPRCSA